MLQLTILHPTTAIIGASPMTGPPRVQVHAISTDGGNLQRGEELKIRIFGVKEQIMVNYLCTMPLSETETPRPL